MIRSNKLKILAMMKSSNKVMAQKRASGWWKLVCSCIVNGLLSFQTELVFKKVGFGENPSLQGGNTWNSRVEK